MEEQPLLPDQLASIFTRFVQQVADAANARTSPLLERFRAHLGADPVRLQVTVEQFDTFEQPNLQVALDAYLKARSRNAELIGINTEHKRFMAAGLSELATGRGPFPQETVAEGPVDYVNFHLADGRVLACVHFGLYFIRAGKGRLLALVMGPSEMGDPRRQKLRVEVMSARPADLAAFLEEIRELMSRLNIYRGHTISLSAAPLQLGPGPVSLVRFQTVPKVARDDVVLPEGVLERIERHTITFSEHSGALLAAGRSLKRGLLLYGLPGTGKTLTVMYLAGCLDGRTVLLTTGRGLGMVETIAQIARHLAPAMVVLEDVDLVAEERTMPGFGARPVLFELLNEMDGLRDDQDVIFVLTTNRPDILEPALAARPGRIDLAVELPLPDASGRRRLLDLYGRGLQLEGVDMEALIERTEGATPAFIKELIRKAALHAAEAGTGPTIRQGHIDAALEEMAQGGRLAERILGFRPEPAGGETRFPAPRPPTGFPSTGWGIGREG